MANTIRGQGIEQPARKNRPATGRCSGIRHSAKRTIPKRLRRIACLAASVLLAAVIMGSAANCLEQWLQPEKGENLSNASPWASAGNGEVDKADLMRQISAMQGDYPEVADILQAPEKYPEFLLALLLRNPETLGFVLGYPLHNGQQADVDVSAEAAAGELPHFLQWDTRWGYAQYGDGMMALTGCGPTCLSMVAVYLTGNATYTPQYVAQQSEANGYYAFGVGTKWELMYNGAALLGLRGEELPLDKNRIQRALESGAPIICSVRPGDFTTTGHFIVLDGVRKDSSFLVKDPNSNLRSNRAWSYEELAPQITNLWAFYTT